MREEKGLPMDVRRDQFRLYAPTGDAPFSEDPRSDPHIEGVRPIQRFRWYRPQRPQLRRNLRR